MPARFVALALALTASGGLLTATRGVPVLPDPAAAGRAVLPVAQEAVAAEAGVAPSPAAVSRVPEVAPLRVLRRPDLMVTLARPMTPAQAQRLRRIRGVEALTTLDLGTARLHGRSARVAGVDPSQFRAFTPRETAGVDALWAGVARGEVVPTYGVLRARDLVLGSTVTLTGRQSGGRRVGGVAVFGIPGIDLVTDRRSARGLGIPRDSALVVAAPQRGVVALRRDVRAVLGSSARVEVLRPEPLRASRSRPRSYRELYVESARLCRGLPWQVLAAVGEVESGHGRDNGPSTAGALGPMQFLPATWAAYGVDGDGDGRADVQNPLDAVPAAALYLCRNGAGQGSEGLYNALFAYNHADWYVKKVLAAAARYA